MGIQLVLSPVGTADDVPVKLAVWQQVQPMLRELLVGGKPVVFAAISNPAMTYCGATGTLPEITKM